MVSAAVKKYIKMLKKEIHLTNFAAKRKKLFISPNFRRGRRKKNNEKTFTGNDVVATSYLRNTIKFSSFFVYNLKGGILRSFLLRVFV